MADDNTANDPGRSMTDADRLSVTDTAFTPAVPLKGTTVDNSSDDTGGTAAPGLGAARQQLRDATGKIGEQASDKVRSFAEIGKDRAGGALDQLAQMLTEAAGQVDGKLGAQYGQYARSAADQVQGFSSSVKDKSIDELLDDAREIVRKSPAVAIGAAAAVGFVIARLIQSGLDADKA